jgi:hypothetical protein
VEFGSLVFRTSSLFGSSQFSVSCFYLVGIHRMRRRPGRNRSGRRTLHLCGKETALLGKARNPSVEILNKFEILKHKSQTYILRTILLMRLRNP